MLRYRVSDLDRFFLLYELEPDEEKEVSKRFEAGESLYVFQNGSARWLEEEEIVAPEEDGEFASDEAFALEAERCGSVAVADDEEEEEDLESVQAGLLQDEED